MNEGTRLVFVAACGALVASLVMIQIHLAHIARALEVLAAK